MGGSVREVRRKVIEEEGRINTRKKESRNE
jgi:hypothetical protein